MTEATVPIIRTAPHCNFHLIEYRKTGCIFFCKDFFKSDGVFYLGQVKEMGCAYPTIHIVPIIDWHVYPALADEHIDDGHIVVQHRVPRYESFEPTNDISESFGKDTGDITMPSTRFGGARSYPNREQIEETPEKWVFTTKEEAIELANKRQEERNNNAIQGIQDFSMEGLEDEIKASLWKRIKKVEQKNIDALAVKVWEKELAKFPRFNWGKKRSFLKNRHIWMSMFIVGKQNELEESFTCNVNIGLIKEKIIKYMKDENVSGVDCYNHLRIKFKEVVTDIKFNYTETP